jgi:hypothetical protein
MAPLSTMDRQSRAQWQAAAARNREWYAKPRTPGRFRSRSVVRDVKFAHGVLLGYARSGEPFDPYWWA